jgi:ADP-ribosylglycohydrolase
MLSTCHAKGAYRKPLSRSSIQRRTRTPYAVRNAVSLGGDSDTLACIAGAIAEAFYNGVPGAIRAKVEQILAPDLWQITKAFYDRYV